MGLEEIWENIWRTSWGFRALRRKERRRFREWMVGQQPRFRRLGRVRVLEGF